LHQNLRAALVHYQQLRLGRGTARSSGLDFAIKSGEKSSYNLFALMLDGEVFNLTALKRDGRDKKNNHPDRS
jgi:hypothetical protein